MRGGAGPPIERPAVPGTDDFVLFNNALSQWTTTMQANIVHRRYFAACLATQITRPFSTISMASPSGGSSDVEQRRSRGIGVPLEDPSLGMRCNSVKQGDDQDTAASKSIPKGTLKDAAGNLPAALTMRDNAASRVRWPFFLLAYSPSFICNITVGTESQL